MKRFFERFKYQYKKYLAITFISLAIACLIGSAIVSVINISSGSGLTISSLSFVWNFVVLMVCFVMLFQGNMNGSATALNGVLSYIFLSVLLVFFNSYGTSSIALYDLVAGIRNGNVQAALYGGFTFVFMVGQLVFGVLAWIRLRQYMMGRYSNIKTIVFYVISFLCLQILTTGFELVYFGLTMADFKIYLYLLEPIAELFASLCCVFTILRLKD